MKANIKKDEDGLDNIDDFWNDDEQDEQPDQNDNQDYNEIRRHSRRMSSPPQRQYLEQELPEELLSTPTSRRLRNVPMSRGSASSSMGLSLPGGSMYDNAADEYHSPSFHAVKKRLVFTNDSSDIEPEQDDYQPAIRQTKKVASSSPSLDKLLSASRQKNAQIKANVARVSPVITSRSTVRPVTSTVANSRPQMTSAAASRRAGMPKAFDLGGDFDDEDDQDDNIDQNDNYDLDNGDAEQDDLDEPVPTTPKRSSRKPSSVRTPAEFTRKSKVAQVPKTTEIQSEDDDHEPEPEDEVDDRIRFSDEDDISNKYAEEEEEERRPAVNRKAADPVQKKRLASTKEPKSNNRSKLAAAASKDIPKSNKSASDTVNRTKGQKAPNKISQAAAVKDTDEDDGLVPLSTQRKSTNGKSNSVVAATGSKKTTKATANKSSRVNSNRGARNASSGSKGYEAAVELVAVPVVPDVGADNQGVRRSHRTKITPLEFWKNERVVIGKDADAAPVIKAVLRAPPEESHPKSKKRKRASASSNSKRGAAAVIPRQRRKQARTEVDEDELDSSLEENVDSQSGMGLSDEVANKRAEVLTFGTNKVTSRVIAESKDTLNFKDVEGGQYLFHRGLEDADSLASGIIKIKPSGKKPTTNSNGSSMVFFVMKGLVQVTIHETDFVVSTGGRFLVPRGNQYGISNLSKKESTLFFTQNKIQSTKTSDNDL
ncbi:hypothetical protein BGX26_011171 [Mortierella sp. AD094]|nr:hypothetical protein BGX26_011171 [Mortierella sp. AD094]